MQMKSGISFVVSTSSELSSVKLTVHQKSPLCIWDTCADPAEGSDRSRRLALSRDFPGRHSSIWQVGSPEFISPVAFWFVTAPLVTLQLLPTVLGTAIMTFASNCNLKTKAMACPASAASNLWLSCLVTYFRPKAAPEWGKQGASPLKGQQGSP